MVRFFAVYQAKCPSVLLVVVRNSTTTADTESWYGIQYLDDGREKCFEHSTVVGTTLYCTHVGEAVRDPKKWFSAVSRSNLALRILKLRREDFKQIGSSTFKIA